MRLVSFHIVELARNSTNFEGFLWTHSCISEAPEALMDPLTISAASGLRSRMDALDLLANNLANAETSGYKSDREFYGLYTSPEAYSSQGGEFVTTLPVVQKQWTDFSQGTLTS